MRNVFDKNFERASNIREKGMLKGSVQNIKDDIQDIKDNFKNVIDFFKHDYRTDTKNLVPGDILTVSRPLPYLHIGVYIGNDRVIHFAGTKGDFKGKKTIHEAPIKEFLGNYTRFEVLHFEEKRREGLHLNGFPIAGGIIPNLANEWSEHTRNKKYHLYTPEETVERAKSIANIEKQENYHLLFNNCEHFAIWCKTGIGESKQVDRVFRFFNLPVKQKKYSTA